MINEVNIELFKITAFLIVVFMFFFFLSRNRGYSLKIQIDIEANKQERKRTATTERRIGKTEIGNGNRDVSYKEEVNTSGSKVDNNIDEFKERCYSGLYRQEILNKKGNGNGNGNGEGEGIAGRIRF